MFTKDIPTQEGYYWIKEGDIVTIYKLGMYDGRPWREDGYLGLHIIVGDEDFVYHLPKGENVYYSGPLVAPTLFEVKKRTEVVLNPYDYSDIAKNNYFNLKIKPVRMDTDND